MEPVSNTSSHLLYRSGIGETFGNAVWPIMQKAYHGRSCVHGLFITATLAQEKVRFTRWKRQRGKTGWAFQKTRLEGLLSTSARAPPPLREGTAGDEEVKSKTWRNTNQSKDPGHRKTERGLKAVASPPELGGLTYDLSSRGLRTAQARTATAGGEGILAWHVRDYICIVSFWPNLHLSWRAPQSPHQSPSYKHHTQFHYTESVSPTGSRPHPESSVLGWASLARSRNLGIHHSQVIIT